MRKPRAIVFDDDESVRSVLTRYLRARGYEVLAEACPAGLCATDGEGQDFCRGETPCCDVLITDIDMPGADGVALLEHQARKGCRVDARNKAVMSGLVDDHNRQRVQQLGCSVFELPDALAQLAEWLAGCESRQDLSRQLASRRRENRFVNHREITYTCSLSGQVREGVVQDVSPSGLCLRASVLLTPAQAITIDGSHFPCCQSASVRWSRQLGEGAFLAGVQCAPAAGITGREPR